MNYHRMIVAVAAALLAVTSGAQAAGFALIEQSASGLGNAFAGGAAAAEDASTIYFNPAGMSYLPDGQLVIALHAIRPSAELTNNGTTSVLGAAVSGNNGGDAGDLAFVPNFYYARAITDQFRLGIGVNAPFGLKTEYNDGWVGRYHALKSDLKTLNINPSASFKVNDTLSFGAGINYQRIKADLTKAVDFGSVCVAKLGAFAAACSAVGLTPGGSDGKSQFVGDDWSWGYNLGATFQATPTTRMGLAYRSEIRHELSGKARISGEEQFNALTAAGIPASSVAALVAAFQNSSVSADADLPATLSASIFHQANDKLDLMADVTWTEWSSFKTLRVTRTSGTLSGSTLDVQPENWENSLRYSVGASYRYTDALKLRVGVAYDESPVSSAWLTPRIPDEDRTWLSFGANYKVCEKGTLDVGYTHLFISDRKINTAEQAAAIAALGGSSAAGVLKGTYDSEVNILSVQYTHTF